MAGKPKGYVFFGGGKCVGSPQVLAGKCVSNPRFEAGNQMSTILLVLKSFLEFSSCKQTRREEKKKKRENRKKRQ